MQLAKSAQHTSRRHDRFRRKAIDETTTDRPPYRSAEKEGNHRIASFSTRYSEIFCRRQKIETEAIKCRPEHQHRDRNCGGDDEPSSVKTGRFPRHPNQIRIAAHPATPRLLFFEKNECCGARAIANSHVRETAKASLKVENLGRKIIHIAPSPQLAFQRAQRAIGPLGNSSSRPPNRAGDDTRLQLDGRNARSVFGPSRATERRAAKRVTCGNPLTLRPCGTNRRRRSGTGKRPWRAQGYCRLCDRYWTALCRQARVGQSNSARKFGHQHGDRRKERPCLGQRSPC